MKYKKCCSSKDDAARSAELAAQAAARAARAKEQAEREAEAEGDAAPDAKVTKSSARHGAPGGVRAPRPKLPSPHTLNLPRRGAV